jgi:hypothetical protein
VIKSFFQQDSYGGSVESKVEAIDVKAKAFGKRAKFLLHQRTHDIHGEVRENNTAVKTLMAVLEGMVRGANCELNCWLGIRYSTTQCF